MRKFFSRLSGSGLSMLGIGFGLFALILLLLGVVIWDYAALALGLVCLAAAVFFLKAAKGLNG